MNTCIGRKKDKYLCKEQGASWKVHECWVCVRAFVFAWWCCLLRDCSCRPFAVSRLAVDAAFQHCSFAFNGSGVHLTSQFFCVRAKSMENILSVFIGYHHPYACGLEWHEYVSCGKCWNSVKLLRISVSCSGRQMEKVEMHTVLSHSWHFAKWWF